MKPRGKGDKASQPFVSEEEAIKDVLRRSTQPGATVSPGEALTLEQTVEVLQRVRSRQYPGSYVSLFLESRHRP